MKIARAVFVNLLCLVLAWGIAWSVVKLGARTWIAISSAQIAAVVVVSVLAVLVRARTALFVLCISGAAIAVETAVHITYGIDKVQGFPSHLSVMLASVVGILLGRTVLSRPFWDAKRDPVSITES
jgi:hypothetical protein